MSLVPYKSNVEKWKKIFGGVSTTSLTTNPVATVARAGAILKRQNGIKGGAAKKVVRRSKATRVTASRGRPRKPVKRKPNKTRVKRKTVKKSVKKTVKKKIPAPRRKTKKVCFDLLS